MTASPFVQTHDPRELPAYTISEAAHYLGTPASTIRHWAVGWDDSEPLIQVPRHSPVLLSFFNLTELHVLVATRRKHGVKTQRESIRVALRRIDRDAHGMPCRLYPFTRDAIGDAPAMIVIDPALSGGRPVIAGTGVATELIAERYKAGESVRDLAYDYECGQEEIEEAIRWEIQTPA